MTSFDKISKSLMALLGQSAYREKLARLLQYYAKYLTSAYAESLTIHPHLVNQITAKTRKADSLFATMGATRRILRFGPSIVMIKTLITNLAEILSGKNKQPMGILICKTLSAVWIGIYFILDHYIWLYNNKIVSNDKLKKSFDYYAILGWYLDCWTGVARNIITYYELNEKQRQEQFKPMLIDFVRYLIDLPVAYGFMKPGTVPGKVIGACGTVTSLISLYQMWK